MPSSDAARAAAENLPWLLENADVLGFVLIILMVVLVVWRAATRQPVSAAEALIGIVGIVVIALPVLTDLTFKGFGLELSAKVNRIDRTSFDITGQIADIKADHEATRRELKLLARNVWELRNRQAGGGVKFNAQGGVGLLSDLTGAPADGMGNMNADQYVRRLAKEASSPNQDYGVLIYYRDSQRERAQKLLARLLEDGFASSATLTDLSEAAGSADAGDIRLLYNNRGAEKIEPVRKLIETLFERSVPIVSPDPHRLVKGDIQIQFF